MAKSFKETIGDEFSDIKEILSGEMKLREREEKLAKLKEEAKKKQKAEKRKRVIFLLKKLYRILSCLNGRLLIGISLILNQRLFGVF